MIPHTRNSRLLQIQGAQICHRIFSVYLLKIKTIRTQQSTRVFFFSSFPAPEQHHTVPHSLGHTFTQQSHIPTSARVHTANPAWLCNPTAHPLHCPASMEVPEFPICSPLQLYPNPFGFSSISIGAAQLQKLPEPPQFLPCSKHTLPALPVQTLLCITSLWQRATFYQPPSKTKLARGCSSRNWRGKAVVLFYNSISKFIQKKHPYNHGRFYVHLTSSAKRLVPLKGTPHCPRWPTTSMVRPIPCSLSSYSYKSSW